jgi:superfamily II DNA or RNA helicase
MISKLTLAEVSLSAGAKKAETAATAPDAATTMEEDVVAFPEPSTAALEWLENLNGDAVSATQAKAMRRTLPRRLLYLLRPGQTMQLLLAKSRLSKNGEWNKPTAYWPQPHDLVGPHSHYDFIAEEDRPLLRLFLALQAGRSYAYYYREAVDLVEETGALLLQQALRTGRLFLENDLAQPLQAGPPQPLHLCWQPRANGMQQLAIDVPDHWQTTATAPPFYLDPENRLLGELQCAVPNELLKKLLAAPPLSDADAPLVRQQLARFASQYAIDLPLPKAETGLPAGQPAARLLLGRARFQSPGGGSEQHHAVATLFFDYPEGFSVAASENPTPMLRQHAADGQWRVWLRDLVAEKDFWQCLQVQGLESWRQRLPHYRRLDAKTDCFLLPHDDAATWLAFLDEAVPALEQAGIRVAIADDFPYQLAAADEWFADIEPEAGNDWFTLDLGVMVGGQRVSLVPPLLRLLREQPRLLTVIRTLDDKETIPVALDDRRYLPVPASRLKAWLLPLLEFIDEDRPRLARHHVSVLADLEGHVTRWMGSGELRDLGKKLKAFSGLTRQPPAPGFLGTLRPYQQIGLDWLQFLREYGLAGILADDMGLGKTIQALAHVHLEKASGRADRPSLVVAPTSLMLNWQNEAAQFAPELKVLVLHGKDRAAHFADIGGCDLVLTTYPLLVRDREALLAHEYHLLILDEAQFIKNPKAQSHQVARQIQARHRLSLTGTPLENHLGELWAQFDFLLPGLLGRARMFSEIFRTPIEKQGDEGMRRRLAARVRPFLLRRTKEQVLQELPPRTEVVRWIELEGGQRDIYESLRVVFDKKLRQALTEHGARRSQIMILDALLKLRQVCCDPRLLKLATAEALVKKGVAASAKLATLMEMLEELLDENRKVLLFSQFTSMLALIEPELVRRGIPFVKLTGQTRDRATPINDFQSGRVPLFLISLKAGGTGLNLTAADTVIHYDPWWNPAVEEQATARAHRIGQDKPVFVYKLMTRGTVEERILALQGRKKGFADRLIAQQPTTDAEGGHLLTAADLDVLLQPLG